MYVVYWNISTSPPSEEKKKKNKKYEERGIPKQKTVTTE